MIRQSALLPYSLISTEEINIAEEATKDASLQYSLTTTKSFQECCTQIVLASLCEIYDHVT